MRYKQNGNGGDGILGEVEPGSRIKGLIDKVREDSPDLSQGTDMVPESPGPSVAGRTPVIGSVRRDMDLPVARDQLPDFVGN